ncbi:hypothetical protein [Flavobacterium sp. 25HG05S-40]|uniref:hypothetical protein n=1 Tax=Flavobacterium sp. 25HG05S-40 TaxID=3458682 RepID=UPI0040444711
MKKALLIIIFSIFFVGCFSENKSEYEKNKEEQEELKFQAWSASKEFVKKELKSPGSAEFNFIDDGINSSVIGSITESDTTFTVIGTFDAQNSFGASIRNDFKCELALNYGTFSLINLDIE